VSYTILIHETSPTPLAILTMKVFNALLTLVITSQQVVAFPHMVKDLEGTCTPHLELIAYRVLTNIHRPWPIR
jgi:hypothetical protein